MNMIQKILLFVTITVIYLMIMVMPAESAVTTTDISATEFNTLISTHPAAWSVMYRGGSTLAGTGNEEIRLSRNIATPQVGGGSNTIVANHTWSRPDQIELLIDSTGNLSARAGSTLLSAAGFAVTQPFNQVLIRVFDNSGFGSSDLQELGLNGFDIRDMLADGSGPSHSNDIISVNDFGVQAPFSFTANWDSGLAPLQNDQYVWIVALQNATIPEPSAILLTGLTSLLALRRKR